MKKIMKWMDFTNYQTLFLIKNNKINNLLNFNHNPTAARIFPGTKKNLYSTAKYATTPAIAAR